jgi:hypothetical protein
MNPGDRNSKFTWSYHYSLSRITKMITKHGLLIEDVDELVSNKQSEGKNSKMENLARNEFPLFMTILATKIL